MVGNQYSEIKSHSSVLYNERMNILFTMLNAEKIDLGINPDIKQILKVKSILEELWGNIRSLIFYAPMVRTKLKLDTDKSGIYTVDVGFFHIQECINHLMEAPEEATYRRLDYIARQIKDVDILIKEVLQFFSYFIRPDYKQMPDFDTASERYKNLADKKTLEQLQSVIGKRSKDVFDSLDIPLADEYFDEDEKE